MLQQLNHVHIQNKEKRKDDFFFLKNLKDF